jgi:hypothetical protein
VTTSQRTRSNLNKSMEVCWLVEIRFSSLFSLYTFTRLHQPVVVSLPTIAVQFTCQTNTGSVRHYCPGNGISGLFAGVLWFPTSKHLICEHRMR